MMNCPKCNKSISINNNFCLHCGNKIEINKKGNNKSFLYIITKIICGLLFAYLSFLLIFDIEITSSIGIAITIGILLCIIFSVIPNIIVKNKSKIFTPILINTIMSIILIVYYSIKMNDIVGILILTLVIIPMMLGVGIVYNVITTIIDLIFLFINKSITKTEKPTIQNENKCPKCGNICSINNTYCTSCGEKMIKEKQNEFCTTCGNKIINGNNYCTSCGAIKK